MDAKQLLQKYHGKMVRHAIIKSLMLALIPAFVALLVTSAIWWFFGLKALWLCPVIALAVLGGFTPLFYKTKYRPSIKNTARSVDALGLEERLVTMTEFEGQSSVLIEAQRRDAMEKISTVSEKLIKFAVPVVTIVALSVSAVLGIGMTTVAAVTEQPGMDVILGLVTPDPEKFDLEYAFEGDGDIQGEIIQQVEEGQAGTPVTAVPAEGWVFVQWSDGLSEPYRYEKRVMADTTITAIFEMVELMDDQEDQQGQGGPGDGEMMPGGEQQEGEGQPGKDSPESDQGQPQASGQYLNINQVYDGQTYYGGEVFENAYEDVVEELLTNEELSEAEKEIIERYFDTIKK